MWSGLVAISHTHSVPFLNDILYNSWHVPCQCISFCTCGNQKSIYIYKYINIQYIYNFRVTSATLAKTDTKVLSLSIRRAATVLIPSPIHIHAAYQIGQSQALRVEKWLRPQVVQWVFLRDPSSFLSWISTNENDKWFGHHNGTAMSASPARPGLL